LMMPESYLLRIVRQASRLVTDAINRINANAK
jgi:hypothetical protein